MASVNLINYSFVLLTTVVRKRDSVSYVYCTVSYEKITLRFPAVWFLKSL